MKNFLLDLNNHDELLEDQLFINQSNFLTRIIKIERAWVPGKKNWLVIQFLNRQLYSSFLHQLQGKSPPVRDRCFYEYNICQLFSSNTYKSSYNNSINKGEHKYSDEDSEWSRRQKYRCFKDKKSIAGIWWLGSHCLIIS